MYICSQPYLRKQCRALEIAVDVPDQIQALSGDLAVVLQGRHLYMERKTMMKLCMKSMQMAGENMKELNEQMMDGLEYVRVRTVPCGYTFSLYQAGLSSRLMATSLISSCKSCTERSKEKETNVQASFR